MERELIDLITRLPDWYSIRLEVAAIRLGTQRLKIELAASCLGDDPLVLSFENIGGKIEAAIEQVGWAGRLTEGQHGTLVATLRGLLDMAAVERIHGRERIESAEPLGPGFADLPRRMTWAEWVERWTLTAGVNHDNEPDRRKTSLETIP